MKTPKHTSDPLLKKSHANKSKKDYSRKSKHPVTSERIEDHISGMPHLDIQKLTDKTGSHE